MNQFPHFEPHGLVAHQLTSSRLNLVSLGQKSNQIQPGLGYRVSQTPGGTTISVVRRRGGGGSAPACTAFKLTVSTADKFTVSESTVAGLTPSGFTAGLQEFTVVITDGVVFAKLIIDSAGDPVSATVEQDATLPTDTATDFHRQIGTFHVEGTGEDAVLSVSQTRCGPFEAAICRNWFAAEAPFYGITWL